MPRPRRQFMANVLACMSLQAPTRTSPETPSHSSRPPRTRTRPGRLRGDDPDLAWVAYSDEPELIVDTGIARSRLGEAALDTSTPDG